MPEQLQLIDADKLPQEIVGELSQPQREGLAFASKELLVVGEPKIQTFQVGSTTHGRGNVVQGGLGRSLGQNWGVFGSVGTINLHQQTVNTFKTDIQLRLEDAETKEKIFLDQSIPFAVTVSVASGDKLKVFYLKGGMPNPIASDDFHANDWTPFVARNLQTNQIIPLSSVPSFAQKKLGAGAIVFGVGMLIVSLMLLTNPSTIIGAVVFACIGAMIVIVEPLRLSINWNKNIRLAREATARIYKNK